MEIDLTSAGGVEELRTIVTRTRTGGEGNYFSQLYRVIAGSVVSRSVAHDNTVFQSLLAQRPLLTR